MPELRPNPVPAEVKDVCLHVMTVAILILERHSSFVRLRESRCGLTDSFVIAK